ncbi:MAG TPA: hypothetical protein VHX12_09580 [Acidisoma sp.]|nr:hypothetical protein [Acidisoma sp.]
MAETLAGGWTPWRDLSAEDLNVFHEAMQGFVGVKYTPEKVSTQVVAGTNYRFRCEAAPLTHPIIYTAVVQIYAPLDGKPYITHISPV